MHSDTSFISILVQVALWMLTLPSATSFLPSRHHRLCKPTVTPLYMDYAPRSPTQTFQLDLKQVCTKLILLPSIMHTLSLRPAHASTSNPSVEITDYAYFDLKIANYTEESIGTNQGARGSGRIKIALFGREAPKSVSRFLSTLEGDGIQFPNYVNSQFTRIVNGTLLEIERVKGINTVDIAGTESFEFKGNLLTEFTPILESNELRHTKYYIYFLLLFSRISNHLLLGKGT